MNQGHRQAIRASALHGQQMEVVRWLDGNVQEEEPEQEEEEDKSARKRRRRIRGG